METTDEAKRLFKISLGKLECMKALRVSKSIHKNLLVNTIFNKVFSIVTDVDYLTQDFVRSESSLLATNEPDSNITSVNEPQYTTLESATVSGRVNDSFGSPFEDQVIARQKQELLTTGPTISSHQECDSSSEFLNDKRGVKRGGDSGEDDFGAKRCRTVTNVNRDESHWRSSSDISDFEDESDLDTDCDVTSPVLFSYLLHDENAIVDTPMDVQQISSLVTVFSSSFSGLGDFEEDVILVKPCQENEPYQIIESNPVRRVNSMPNLFNKSPECKTKKNSPVLLRI